MKKSLNTLMIAILLVLSTTINAQIKNSKTETVKIHGNCGMCETKIEKAGNIKNVASVDWNQDTGMANITYDSTKTNKDEILKRIALVGYDSDKFLAPDDVYNNLHGCCQYDRVAKVPVQTEAETITNTDKHANHNHSATQTNEAPKLSQLDAVYENYFSLKDALVKTDGTMASSSAKELISSINAVKMSELKMDIHMVWMKVLENLKKDAKAISESTDEKKQRGSFNTLSKSIYELIKVSKSDVTVYYQFCPMANDGKGANWLSKENNIKNPYFGSMMLSCGKVVETIK
jgi:copper chaperone CopZ